MDLAPKPTTSEQQARHRAGRFRQGQQWRRGLAVAALGAATIISGCGGGSGSGGLSASSTCADFNNADQNAQARWVRAALDPNHQRDQYSFAGLMDTVSGHCAASPDDKLQVFIDEHLGG